MHSDPRMQSRQGFFLCFVGSCKQTSSEDESAEEEEDESAEEEESD
jgi:hypothetical protein